MKKRLFFTNNVNSLKQANLINTYVNFVYDTKTGELKLVDCFNGETKEVVVATIDKSSGSEEGGEGGQGGEGSGQGEGSGEGGEGQGQGGEGGEGQGGEGGQEGGDEPVEP